MTSLPAITPLTRPPNTLTITATAPPTTPPAPALTVETLLSSPAFSARQPFHPAKESISTISTDQDSMSAAENIPVSKETYNQILDLRQPGETPDRTLARLVEKVKKQRLTDDIEEVMARNEFVELDLDLPSHGGQTCAWFLNSLDARDQRVIKEKLNICSIIHTRSCLKMKVQGRAAEEINGTDR